MASEFSDYLTTKFLNFIKGTSAGTAPPSLYVALYSSDPGPDGTAGTDVTDTVRVAGRVAVAAWSAITSRAISNDADVDFGAAAGGATVTHYGLWDASTAGNFYGGTALLTPRTFAAAYPAKFLAGDLIVAF